MSPEQTDIDQRYLPNNFRYYCRSIFIKTAFTWWNTSPNSLFKYLSHKELSNPTGILTEGNSSRITQSKNINLRFNWDSQSQRDRNSLPRPKFKIRIGLLRMKMKFHLRFFTPIAEIQLHGKISCFTPISSEA